METRADACMMMGEFSFVASKRVLVLKKNTTKYELLLRGFFLSKQTNIKGFSVAGKWKKSIFSWRSSPDLSVVFPQRDISP